MKTCPHAFVPADTPDDEMPRPDYEAPDHGDPLIRIAPPLSDDEAVVVDEAFYVHGRGRFDRGQRVRRDDPIVGTNPQMFREVGRRLDEIDSAA